MQKTVGVTELRRRFQVIFDEVVKGRIPYVLTRGSRPMAVLISYQDYQRFQAMQEQTTLDRFDQLVARMAQQQADVNEADVADDVAAALTELDD